MRKICIDSGHYGSTYNKGAHAEYFESARMFKLTQYQKEALESLGLSVILVRKNINDNPELTARGRKAQGCDLFISNHSNASSSSQTDYPCSVVFSGVSKLDKQSQEIGIKLAQVVGHVLETKQPAKTITRLSNNGSEYFGVLRGSKSVNVPGVIIEHSFHSNPIIAELLMSDEILREIANKQALIIAQWLGVDVIEFNSFYVEIETDLLNIRLKPDTYSEIVAKVRKGEIYKIAQKQGKWLKLDSWNGWVYEDYISKI